jgi:hypothetical protein
VALPRLPPRPRRAVSAAAPPLARTSFASASGFDAAAP